MGRADVFSWFLILQWFAKMDTTVTIPANEMYTTDQIPYPITLKENGVVVAVTGCATNIKTEVWSSTIRRFSIQANVWSSQRRAWNFMLYFIVVGI